MDDKYYSQDLNDSMNFNNSFYSQESLPDLLSASVPSYSRTIEEHRLSGRHFNNQNYNMNINVRNGLMPLKYHGSSHSFVQSSGAVAAPIQSYGGYGERNRYAPYYVNRMNYASVLNNNQYQQQCNQFYGMCNSTATSVPSCYAPSEQSDSSKSTKASSGCNLNGFHGTSDQINQPVTLQINHLDCSLDENSLRHIISNQLKPITPIVALTFEGKSFAKVTVPNANFAKLVVSNLHRKRIGHKRMVVSYTRDSSLTEINTLRCQVAGLLKDVPYGTLSMCKFRELFQSRFKTSIGVLDFSKMQDICNIRTEENDEKYISLQPDFLNSINNGPMMECLQHSVPYCTIHFKREQHKGWAEQEIEPLPNVFMTISEIQSIIYPLLKNHTGEIPIASLVHCIKEELGVEIKPNDKGVNLEHLICCIHGIRITTNNFGIKILGWLEPENVTGKDSNDGRFSLKFGATSDPLYQISRETIDLVKMSPKSTMKFNRFIPAYHNHFGKQCRVAEYGYTKLIELFEALSSVIQIMGDGENRLITLHHRTQVRRFTSDLLRILRAQGNKSILLSQLPAIFAQSQNRKFDITEYGVCDVVDILDGLVNSNTVVITRIQNGSEILISIPKRKQTPAEMEKTSIFAGEVVELLRNASQYSIVFQKFVRSYHYHFGYQCRLSDYGFVKLVDLMEAIQGIVEIESTNDEDKQIRLSTKIAQRVFAEQLEDLVREFTGCGQSVMQLEEVLQLHKKKYGYQIQAQTLGVVTILDALKVLPYVELLETDGVQWIICHNGDHEFRSRCYSICKIIQDSREENILLEELIKSFSLEHNVLISEHDLIAMKHAIEVNYGNGLRYLTLTNMMKFLVNIIRILDQRCITLGELKECLHVGITDCSAFGFPNLFSLLKAYSDVFVIELGSSHDRSEIHLLSQGNAVPLGQRSSQRKPLGSINPQKSPPRRQLQALLSIENKLNCMEALSSQHFIRQHVRESASFSSAVYSSNKENYTSSSLIRPINSSLLSDPKPSAGAINEYSGCQMGLWNRRQDRYIREHHDVARMYTNRPQPKADTPFTENTPFWLDPIWMTNPYSSQIHPFILKEQEFRSLNVSPQLMSPYTLSKMVNMKKIFSFDHSDKMKP